MRSIKLLVLAFVAVLSCGAIAATSASALLFLTVLNLELFSVNSATTTRLTVLSKVSLVECQVTLAHGYALNKTDRVDLLLFTFHKCTLGAGGAPCQSTGEPEGLIKTLDLRGLLVTLKNGSTTKNFGMKIEPEVAGKELAEFTCASGAEKVTVTGAVVGEFTEAENNVGFTETNLKFATNGEEGMPKWPSYETLEGVGTAILKSVFAGLIVGESESAEEGEGKIKLLHEGKICGK